MIIKLNILRQNTRNNYKDFISKVLSSIKLINDWNKSFVSEMFPTFETKFENKINDKNWGNYCRDDNQIRPILDPRFQFIESNGSVGFDIELVQLPIVTFFDRSDQINSNSRPCLIWRWKSTENQKWFNGFTANAIQIKS